MEDDARDDDRFDRAADELYAAEPERFVERRTALAKVLAKDDRDAARRVKALKKPTVAAWGLNSVARERSDDIAELVAAGAAVRRAQRGAVAGEDPGALRDAVDRRRGLIRAMADAVVDVAGESHRDDAEATLEAASVDPEVAEELRRGRLVKATARPTGLDDLAGMAADVPEPAPPERRDRAEVEQLRRRLDRADAAVDRSTERLERAERRLADARADVDDARAALDRDLEARDELAKALDD